MEKDMRRLVIRTFHVDRVVFSDSTGYREHTLSIDKNMTNKLDIDKDIIDNISINIIEPGDHDRHVNCIMDILPISTKVLGVLGEGITHTMTGVYVMLNGAEKNGRQMSNFGSSDGMLSEQLMLDRAGTPGKNDIIIQFDVLIREGTEFGRKLPLAIHALCDNFVQEIREKIKRLDIKQADEKHEFHDIIREDKKKVVIIKQIGGQGAMHDNQLFPFEPSGFEGGFSNIDMLNMPMILSPNEYRDGAIRAMT
ncbi:MAG: proline reductase cluster protein PrdD [Peptostreptococcaceae bacterium]|nr:proline reductase cluster protein PrdD [Peptostreptococcaceae bacterium]